MVYKNFANSHSTIGSMEDLDAATVEDVQEFFRIYYAPNNAVLVLSGAFDVEGSEELDRKIFRDDSEPAGAAAARRHRAAGSRANIRRYMKTSSRRFRRFSIGWKIPPRRTPDFYALYLAGKLLYDGESSRLYQKLVKGEESVIQLFGFTDERRGPSGVVIGAIPKPDKDLSKIRETIMTKSSDIADERSERRRNAETAQPA